MIKIYKCSTKKTNIKVPNHNVFKSGDYIVYNNTNDDRTEVIYKNDKRSVRSVSIPGNPPFVRGLAQLNRFSFLVGSQKPAAVYQVDIVKERIDNTFHLHGEPNESVYDICMIPDKFGDTPTNLPYKNRSI